MLEFLISIFPTFEAYWENDDVYQEGNAPITPYGVMGAFLDYYQNNYEYFSFRQLSSLCMEFKTLVSANRADNNSVANAICTMFLELLVDTKPGDKIEPFLGSSCREFWDHYKI